MSELTIVDNTILTAMATCPTQAAVRYVLGLKVPDDAAPLRAGQLAHVVLEHHLKGASIEDAMTVPEIMSYIAWATDALTDDDRLHHRHVLKVMRRWLETHPVAGLPFRVFPDLIEVGFAVPLADDVIFVGKMDGLVQDDNGAWWVLEHKTTGRLDATWRRRYRTSGQVTGYTWAAQQHLAQPVAGCFINGIEFGRLPTDVKKCRSHGVPYAECGPMHARFDMPIEHRAPHQLEMWKADALRLARRYQSLKAQVQTLDDIAAVPMYGQLINGACQFCQCADWCSVGRPVKMAQAVMIHEPWEPYKHAFGGADGEPAE